MRVLARKITGQVKYYHISRTANTFADYLSQVAVILRKSGSWENAPELVAEAGARIKVPEGMY